MQEFLPITEVQARQRSQGNLTNGGSFLRPSHCRGQAHVQKTDKEQLAGGELYGEGWYWKERPWDIVKLGGYLNQVVIEIHCHRSKIIIGRIQGHD